MAKTLSGGYGAVDVETAGFEFVDGGNDLLCFLPAEHAVLAGVGVQTGYADVGTLDAKLAAGIVDEFYALYDAGLLHQVAGLTQGYVGGDVDDAYVLVGQHHGVLLRMREGGVYLGMAVVVVTGQVQRFLVQGGCHGAVHLVGHGQLDGFLDILEGGIATLRLYLAELEGREVYALHVIDVDGAMLEAGVLDTLYGVDLEVEAKQLDCL